MRILQATAFLLAIAVPGFARQFVATEADFACIQTFTKLAGHRTRIYNRNPRRLEHAKKVLASARPGRRYPVGTIIELVPPLPAAHFLGEAMVKRGGAFNRAGNGWEFFVLGVREDGSTEIVKRGGPEVINIGQPCQGCHTPAKKFDFVCESDRGCIPLNLTQDLIDILQAGDPRCAAHP